MKPYPVGNELNVKGINMVVFGLFQSAIISLYEG